MILCVRFVRCDCEIFNMQTIILIIIIILTQIALQYQCLNFIPPKRSLPHLQITLPQGKLQGSMRRTKEQKMIYYSFEGIPYALPPIHDLRFRPPVPFKSWDGILNAAKNNVSSCIQILPTLLSTYSESEDCLYLHVYTPVQALSNIGKFVSIPVMVWIHGGGFLIGSPDSSYYGPDYILEQYVIVVQFGYRLSSLGFLSTQDMESPGNYGLKDQHLALKWIKDNIQYFGGDPKRITIFGESAGSASVQYQMMYPKNEGLFSGAISESGSVLCSWAFQRYPRRIAFQLGLAAGIRASSSNQLIHYLRHLPIEQLKTATVKTTIMNSMSIGDGITFAPTIEPTHESAFLTNKSHQSLTEGKYLKVPYIIGLNSDEASLAKTVLNFASALLQIFSVDPSILIPSGMNVGNYAFTAGHEIRQRYFGNTKSRAEQILNFINDANFFRPIIESARLFSQNTSVYLYLFEYEGMLGRQALGFKDVDDYKGVLHTEEMSYLFSRNDLPESNPRDRLVRNKMVRLWTNFAKFRNPTPQEETLLDNIKWPTLSKNMEYLDIGSKLIPKEKIMATTVEFWTEIYRKYGKAPYDTY